MNIFNVDKLDKIGGKISSLVSYASEKVREAAASKLTKETPLEKNLRLAINDKDWGCVTAIWAEISKSSYYCNDYYVIIKAIWEGLSEKPSRWRRIYKTLTMVEYLLKNGNERYVDDIRENLYRIQCFYDFRFMENGKDRGSGIREKAKMITELILNSDLLKAEREQANRNRDKFVGISGKSRKAVSESNHSKNFQSISRSDNFSSNKNIKNGDDKFYFGNQMKSKYDPHPNDSSTQTSLSEKKIQKLEDREKLTSLKYSQRNDCDVKRSMSDIKSSGDEDDGKVRKSKLPKETVDSYSSESSSRSRRKKYSKHTKKSVKKKKKRAVKSPTDSPDDNESDWDLFQHENFTECNNINSQSRSNSLMNSFGNKFQEFDRINESLQSNTQGKNKKIDLLSDDLICDNFNNLMINEFQSADDYTAKASRLCNDNLSNDYWMLDRNNIFSNQNDPFKSNDNWQMYGENSGMMWKDRTYSNNPFSTSGVRSHSSHPEIPLSNQSYESHYFPHSKDIPSNSMGMPSAGFDNFYDMLKPNNREENMKKFVTLPSNLNPNTDVFADQHPKMKFGRNY